MVKTTSTAYDSVILRMVADYSHIDSLVNSFDLQGIVDFSELVDIDWDNLLTVYTIHFDYLVCSKCYNLQLLC